MARHVRASTGMQRVIIILALLFAGMAWCQPGYQVEVRFISARGHTKDVFVPLSDEEGRDLQFNPRDARRYVFVARCKYAEQLGYNRTIYGDEYWKIVPGLRVETVKLDLPTGQSVDLP